jgi:3-deoxy-7-phosphoheptulonate synthase/chorismate mutase
MDALNLRLVALLQERARLALAIGRAKARHGLAAPDPAREREMLRAALRSPPSGFPRAELTRLLRTVLAASRRLVVRDRR